MRRLAALALIFVSWAPATAVAAPASYSFGGFSPGGREYWKRAAQGGDQVCEPIAEDAAPACRAVERRDVKGWTKPERARTLAGTALVVSVEEDRRVVLAAGERRLGVYSSGQRVSAVNSNVFVSEDGTLVAVEFEVAGMGGGKRGDVVVFDVAEAPPAPAERKKPGAGAGGGGGNAFERAMKHGGVWEQRMVACDQAGVTLTLKRARGFAIRIFTRCQGAKEETVLGGKWTSEGSDTVVLAFENEDGPTETMTCRLATCADEPEDCMTCGDEDVTFVLEIVRR